MIQTVSLLELCLPNAPWDVTKLKVPNVARHTTRSRQNYQRKWLPSSGAPAGTMLWNAAVAGSEPFSIWSCARLGFYGDFKNGKVHAFCTAALW